MCQPGVAFLLTPDLSHGDPSPSGDQRYETHNLSWLGDPRWEKEAQLWECVRVEAGEASGTRNLEARNMERWGRDMEMRVRGPGSICHSWGDRVIPSLQGLAP